MAEGLLRHYYGDKYEVFSAGTKPLTVNPNAIKVMKEIGIDISNHYSKSVNKFKNEKFDYVITVCDNAKESCPLFLEKAERLHWSFMDPAGTTGNEKEVLNVFRMVRDQIKTKIQKANSGSNRNALFFK